MSNMICAMRAGCKEAKDCGGAVPHEKYGDCCVKCPHDHEAVCVDADEVDPYFHIISDIKAKQEWDKQEIYAIDVRDWTEFCINKFHNIDDLIDCGCFIFGTEK